MEKDKKVSCTILALLYVFMSYLSPVIWDKTLGIAGSSSWKDLILAIPILLGIFNAIYIRINFDKISRSTLLRCAVFVKYLLIPLYILGGLMIIICILIMFIPIVITVFIGPILAALLSAYGYTVMLGGSAFSLAYIRKARQEGIHGAFLSRIGKLLQFFFTVDVISLAVLALKEKKYIKATIMVVIALVLGFIGGMIWLIMEI